MPISTVSPPGVGARILAQVDRRRQLKSCGAPRRRAACTEASHGRQRAMRGPIGWGILPLWMALLLLGACARLRTPLPVVVGLPDGLEAFLASHQLAPGQPLRADRIERSRAASWHVVQVQGAETPHRHRTHDLTVLVLRGAGVLTLDGHATPMRTGDAAIIPRDRVHWFARSGDEPAVALAVFTPPLDAPDSVSESGVDTMGGRR